MEVHLKKDRGIARAFRALTNRNYRLFWSGNLVSLAGTWMQDTALAILVLELTDSPLALGLAMTTRFLPTMLLSLQGGVLADRLPKRKTLVVTECVQFSAALALAVLTSTGAITMALIYVLASIRGAVDAVGRPTRQVFVVEMVGPEILPNAVALNTTNFNTTRVLGPGLAAIVIALFNLTACFYINAASFIASIFTLLAIRERELFPINRPLRAHMFRQVFEGLKYAVATREALVILIVVAAVGTFGYNANTVLPLVANYLLDSGATGLSVLLMAMGVGSVVGGLFAAYWGKATLRLIFVAAVAYAGVMLAMGLSSRQYLTAALVVLMGLTGVLFTTAAQTRLQLAVSGEMRGRIMSIYLLLFAGTTPIGSALVGGLAEKNGVRWMVVEMAIMCALGVLAAVWFAWKKKDVSADLLRERSKEEDPGDSAPV